MGELTSQWNNSPQRRISGMPCTEEDMEEAVIWMLLEERIECVLTRSLEEAREVRDGAKRQQNQDAICCSVTANAAISEANREKGWGQG